MFEDNEGSIVGLRARPPQSVAICLAPVEGYFESIMKEVTEQRRLEDQGLGGTGGTGAATEERSGP